ncbi:MAG: TrkH family potassium uptake protein [Thermomicrobiales bacterium]|nr:TrkH family potassium uptake protein [Thermomicrobiales bacterium]MCO5219963.1 Trk family potassium uptake protein [Thermomicrobiales bacterium]
MLTLKGPPARLRPGRQIFLAFAIAALIGAALLMLPIATESPGGASLSTALFTATSAICLTGLVVVETHTHWSLFGQIVILVLIQLGGFGVMSFASIVGIGIIRRFSLQSRLVAAAESRTTDLADMRAVVLGIIKVSLIVEICTAVVLAARFSTTYGESLPRAAWWGVFHAVSSFNNAGFALFDDSFMQFAGDPVISLALCGAIILGGIGFPVILQLRKYPRTPRSWSMNTRIVLWATVLLFIGGTIFITVLEWNNQATLGSHDWSDRILVGFFQSVQTRSAGFNSVDTGAMEPATWLGMDTLMFIGGGPAGTAGGIKVTTFAVLFFIIVAEIRGDAVVNIFGKRLSRAVHRQAITVALLSVAIVIASTCVLMLITGLSLDIILFEVISAFATVGLSTGVTPELPLSAKLILIALMFIGRLGPFAVASSLALRERHLLYELPKERPIIG